MVIKRTNRPFFRLDHVRVLVQHGHWDYMNYANRTRRHLDDLGWGDDDVGRVLIQLREEEDFRKTSFDCKVTEEWCPSTEVTVDHYCVNWDMTDNCRARKFDTNATELFLKISIAVTEDGDYVGLVSFHPSGTPW